MSLLFTSAPARSAGPQPQSRSLLLIQAERVATLLLIAVVAWAISPSVVFAQNADPAADSSAATSVIQGTVVDEQDGLPLPGANVVLRPGAGESAVAGATTSVDGTYRLTGIDPGTYLLNVSFVGFQAVQQEVSVLPDDENIVDIRLRLESQSLGQVVVSASRRQEKILDAPASISVVRNEQIQQTVASSSAEALRRAMSVDVARTGVNTREVVLRGFNNAFSGDTFVLTDYREAAVPSLDVNLFSSMPISTLDVDRVEIVRGPGSALYGPGVANGVVQFFSRDPFDDPGLGVSVTGGSRAYRGGEFRAAETIGDIGFKVTGRYAAANEWELDPDDPQDLAEIEQYRIYTSLRDIPAGRDVSGGDFNADGERDFRLRREDEYRSFATSGLLQWRPSNGTRVSVNGGYSGVKSVVQSGIGTLQSDMYGYRYGQVRLRSGGFFGQVFYNAIDSGEDSYAYGSGAPFVDESFQWNGQLQYNANAPSIATDFTFGVDGDFVRPRTGGTITGQFEGRDDINQVGAYTQATVSVGANVDLIGAIRADYNNVTEQFRGSPRGAIVYRVNPQNSFRASYNRSYSAPQTRTYFLDVVARNRNIFSSETLGSYDVVLRGIGAVDGFTFNGFRDNRGLTTPNPAVRFFIPDINNTSATDFGQSVSLNSYPVAPVYRAAAAFFQSQVQTGDLNPDLANRIGAGNLDLYGQLLQALSGGADLAARASEADGDVVLGLLNSDAPLGYSEVDAPADIAPLGQTMTQTFEAGYKSEFDRVAFEVSGYYEQKKNFIGPLRQQSPFVYLNRQFLAGNLESTIANSPQAQALIQDLVDQSSFRTPDQLVQALANTLGGTPTAVVQPDNAEQLFAGNVAPDGTQQVGGFLSYRNFGSVQYWGLESSLFYTPADWLEMFSNVSFISDEFFNNVELEESDEQLSVALNAPSFKMKGGATVQFGGGWHIGIIGEYVEGFPVQSGPYIGDVDAYTVFDLSAGYDFGTGLRFDVTANNVFDNQHREFVGAPQIGRLILGRVTYQIQ